MIYNGEHFYDDEELQDFLKNEGRQDEYDLMDDEDED